MKMTERHDLTGPAARTIWVTYAYIAIQFGYAAWMLWYNKVFRDYLDNQGAQELARLDAMDQTQLPVGIGFIVILLAIYAVNARWVFLASRNASITAPSSSRITPGWAVGWFFVPIASLWMPFKAMKETWAASVGGGRQEVDVPGWFSFWWLSWVALTIADTYGSNIGASPTSTSEAFINGNNILAVTSVLWAIPALLFIRIVRMVTANQRGAADVFA